LKDESPKPEKVKKEKLLRALRLALVPKHPKKLERRDIQNLLPHFATQQQEGANKLTPKT